MKIHINVVLLGLMACTQSVGIPGDTGPPGPQGPPGPAGNTGPPGPGIASYFAQQTVFGTPLTSAGPGNWLDVPGVIVGFNTSAAATADLLASGSANGTSDPGGAACCLRFVVDGTPTGEPLYGDRYVNVGPGLYYSFTVAEQAPLGAGSHSIKLQFARCLGPQPDAGIEECQINAALYSLVRLFVTIH